MALSPKWQTFVAEYKKDGRFQYFPHSNVTTEKFSGAMKAMIAFEDKPWVEKTVMATLRKAKLTTGQSSGARMMREAATNLGLCLFENHTLKFTPAGKIYVDGVGRAALLRQTLWRYQLDNPANEGAKGFDIFPHAALVELLLALPDKRVTRDEFILFFGRCRNRAGIEGVIEHIAAWRKLPNAQQDAVMKGAGAEFVTRTTDSSYAMAFHSLASYFSRFSDARRRKGIALSKTGVDQAKELLDLHLLGAEPLDFGATESDFATEIGDPDQSADLRDAVDFYLDRSQYEKAVRAFAKLPAAARGGKTVKQFEQDVFQERDLENYLINNLDLIEKKLKLIKRQKVIRSGVMDIYALAKNGDLVVVELKKTRASDKVFGQLCRYMGCVTQHDAQGTAVRGYIIGSDIDDKLRYAASVLGEPMVRLKRFKRDPKSADIFIEN